MDEPGSQDAEQPTEAAAPVPPPPAPAADQGTLLQALTPALLRWHHRNPLARRLRADDVHTLGLVALPLLRPRQGGAGTGPVEPVLDETVAAPTAAPAAAPAKPLSWPQRLRARLLPTRAGSGALFSEEFIDGLSPARVAAFARAQGSESAPGGPELPLRRIPVDDARLAGAPPGDGGWPVELYLLSAAIDAGPARRRVLIGRDQQVLGRRALDPLRLGLAAGLGLLVLALLLWWAWPRPHKAERHADAPAAAPVASAPAASAASAAAPVASAASAAVAASAASATEATAASAPAGAASEAASEAASAATAASATASSAVPAPDIRPHLGPGRPPLGRAVEERAAAERAAKAGTGASSPASPAASDAQPPRLRLDEVGLVEALRRPADAPPGKVVALVGPPHKQEAQARAELERMQEQVRQALRYNSAIQGDVFRTPDGWRAAIWPFGSRQEAALINATLISRGQRGVRAVDF
ncbi:hypothetical protein LZ017_00925 [Pelomonas sp. CA6]|uniref:hypothetical protein n=1 Tax=Pelomonas sp. CA6 TaxID=2907999 RepID=UPI001F4B1A7E|nr:hypothetical protein [Pelomonas sp. CA6]MCH7341949.1 hypothetical protein [Pelomonas sp. CA6]